jgi:hypothetical protein
MALGSPAPAGTRPRIPAPGFRPIKILSNLQVRRLSLQVVRLIVQRGLYPGDYGKAGFNFCDRDEVDGIIARIDREWASRSGDPTLAEPICWFAPRPA